MKKIIINLIIIFNLLIFVGCGDNMENTLQNMKNDFIEGAKEATSGAVDVAGEVAEGAKESMESAKSALNDINTTKVWRDHKGKIIMGTAVVVAIGAEMAGVPVKDTIMQQASNLAGIASANAGKIASGVSTIGATAAKASPAIGKVVSKNLSKVIKTTSKSASKIIKSGANLGANIFKFPNFSDVVKKAPNQIGVYVVRQKGKVVYVGRAIEQRAGQATSGLRKRLMEHFRGSSSGKKELFQNKNNLNVQTIPLKSVQEVKQMEASLIRKYDTVANGWNKRYEN
jgi:hypothetical protein